MEESNLGVQEPSKNISLDFFPAIERLINQQKTIVCRIQEYIIYETEESDKTPSSEIITPTVKLWQEVGTLKILTEISLNEQRIKEAIGRNLTSVEGGDCGNIKEDRHA